MSIVLIGLAAMTLIGAAVPILMTLRRKGIIDSGFSVDPWSHGVKLQNVTRNSLSFEFPTGDGVHLIDKRGAPKGLAQMSMTFEITGQDPVFISMEGDKPQVRLHMAGARLWSHKGADLQLGRQTFSVPLTPDAWQTVDGFMCNYDQAHINLFNKAVDREQSVGFTFGGENHGYAHGCGLKSGSATFRLIDFKP